MAADEGSLQWGPCEPGQGGNTAAISVCFFVWRPLVGDRCLQFVQIASWRRLQADNGILQPLEGDWTFCVTVTRAMTEPSPASTDSQPVDPAGLDSAGLDSAGLDSAGLDSAGSSSVGPADTSGLADKLGGTLADTLADSAPQVDYVVVARRYRPQTFEELIGQQHVSQALTRAISSGRVGHAYLFTGARGVGKTSAARILAKALNCAEGTSPIPCNACELCLSVSTGDDIDVLEIDGASNRGIDEIRQLRQNVAVRPSRARFKIYIIDEVHMLTKEAFNALLKTLEEPPEHVKFIFATTEPNKIPVTILSRCQRYDFAGIETASIQARLQQIAQSEGATIEDDAVQILAMRAAGSMRDSQSLLEQLLSTGTRAISTADVTAMLGIAPAVRLSQLVAPLIEHDAALAMAQLDGAIAEGAEVSQLLDQLLGYFRDVMTQAVGCDSSSMLYSLPGQHDEIHSVAEKLGVHSLLAVMQILDQTAARMRVSTHTRTLVEMALVRICHLEDLDDLSALIKQLKESPGVVAPASVLKNESQNIAGNTTKNTSKKNGAEINLASQPPTTARLNSLATTSVGTSVGTTSFAKLTEPPQAVDATHQDGMTVKAQASSTAAAELASPSLASPSLAPASLVLSPDNAEAVWKRTLDLLTGMLMDHAAEADEVVVDEQGRLALGFTESFHRDYCEKSNNRARLENALQEVCGNQVTLIMRSHNRIDSSEQPKTKSISRRQQQADLATQPFVKMAIDLFDCDPAKLRYLPPEEK